MSLGEILIRRSLSVLAWLAPVIFCAPQAWGASPYEQTIRGTTGLIAYYSFEGASLANSVGGGREAKVVGAVQLDVESAHPRLGKAARLAGGHLRLPELGRHDAVSIELWLRINKRSTGGLAAIYAGDQWQGGWLHFNLRADGAVELAVNGAGSYPISEPDIIEPDRWRHLVATYDRKAKVQRLFRDGRMIVEVPTDAQVPVTLVAAALGAWYEDGATRPLSADVDELAIYATALPPDQIRAHYLRGKGIELKPVDFARDIHPLLVKRCHECHGSEMQENGLRLDVRDAAFRGGESGEPAVTPYDSERSHLIARVTSKDDESVMPPDGPRLSDAEVALIRNWIDQGAPWPDALAGRAAVEKVSTKHWSFQPVQKPSPPTGDHAFVATGNAIDAFILARLSQSGLAPSPMAERRALIRRLYLDMHGLPPSPEDVQAFLDDPSARAWEQLVDAVLASPRYGERWASHWLDVIRYGDTHGFEVNTPRDNAWPYRDYVIKCLNDDKPYDKFIREQVAGDQLGVDVATGFLVAAPALLQGQVGKDEPSIRLARADELHEVIVSVGSGVLGLTVGCARCHNHKFDPVSQRDYYQLQAVFAGLQYGDRPVRNATQARLSRASAAKAVFGGTFTQPGATFRLYRGDPMQRRERVPPDVPAVFGSLTMETTASDAQRRLAIADWLVDAKRNPLTARVIVNRVWQHHFGMGLVATPSDFGAMGARPTHPELLDWLAATFVEQGWSLKKLHRLILMSSTYRQSSRPNEQGLGRDAQSHLLWRYPPRRLEMEAIRDSILATSGILDLTMGGPGYLVFKPNTNYVRVYDPKEDWGPSEWRRMVYAHRVRMAQDGVFGAFDCPDAGQPAPRRSRSTTAIQALNLLNSSFMKQQSELLAARAIREAGPDVDAQIRRIFALADGRAPTDRELAACRATASEFNLAAVCRAVYNSNEFLFIP